jgi:hypothetical protein
VGKYSKLGDFMGLYIGGVLASNGDLHFVPSAATVGQKINTSGAVSTYSLVYTNSSGAYAGGVLAPNGDIHFIPYAAAVGQKVNSSGTVSTYSLAYTTTAGAYFGGVLTSTGDIYFIPYSAANGEKMSILSGFDFKGMALSSFFNKL